jgi:hypothetical protein
MIREFIHLAMMELDGTDRLRRRAKAHSPIAQTTV